MDDHEENDDVVRSAKAEEERQKTRQGYRKLMDKLANEEEHLVNIDNQHLTGYMQENEELYGKVNTPQEAVLDARVIKQISRICRQQAEGMSANITQFQHTEYADRLVQGMKGTRTEDGTAKLTSKKWVMLGKTVQKMFRKSPSLSYMFGAVDNAPPPPKEKKSREGQKRGTRVKDLVETQETVLEEAEKSETQTEQLVTHTFSVLIDEWRENEKHAVNFFKFVIDPDSFGNTVENIFHVSFLIKDGKAEIRRKPGELPTIRPKNKKVKEGTQGKEEEKKQVVMNISMRDWSLFVKNLNITKAMIPQLKGKESVDSGSTFKKPRTHS